MSATPRTLRTLVRSRQFALLAGIVLTTAIACRDVLSPKQPPTTTPTLKPSSAPLHDESPNNSPDIKSFDLTMIDNADGTMGTSGTSVNYPFATVVRVTVKGMENRTPNYPTGDPITRGPSGHAVWGWYQTGVYTQVNMGPSTDILAESVVVYRQIQGSLTDPGRAGYGKRRYDGAWFNGVRVWCGQDNTNPCDTWTGTTNFKFVRLNAGLTLTVDSTIANSGSRVTFILRSVPDTVEGQQIPVIVDTASWVPDPDSLGGDYSEASKYAACNFSGFPRYCQRTIDGPGTLNVVAYSNGKRFSLSQHIATRDARPIVTASKYYARHAGDTVNFTVHMSDGSTPNMYNWIWFADTTPSHTQKSCPYYTNPCMNTRVFESGYMQVTVVNNGRLKKNGAHVKVGPPPRLQLGANPTTVKYDVPVAFATSAGDAPYTISSWTYHLANGSTGATSCAAPNKTCNSTVPGGGTMTVLGTVDGSPDSASVSLTWLDKYELKARPSLVAAGQVVTFRPYLNGQPAPAASWRWLQQGDASTAWDTVTGCQNGAFECHRATIESGVMWAYRTTAGSGDSASAMVTVSADCPGLFQMTSRARARFGRLVRPAAPIRSLLSGSCTDTSRTNADSATSTLPSMILSITLESPGVGLAQFAGTSGPLDLTIGYPAGTVVPYGVLSQSGYEPPTVVLDSSEATAVGLVTMSRPHAIIAATDTMYALRPGITDLGNRVRAYIDANDKPSAYAAYLIWALDSAPAQFGSDSAFAEAERVAEYVKLDAFNDSAALRQLDDALANYVFEIRGSPTQHSVTVLSPANYDPQINANRVRSRATSSSMGLADTAVFLFVNGIRTVELEARQTSLGLQRHVDGNRTTIPRSFAAYFWNRNIRGQVRALQDTLNCAGRAVRDAQLRQELTTVQRYFLCKGLSIREFFAHDDYKFAILGFMNRQWNLSLPEDPDADRLARLMSWYHGRGKHVVTVPHSQGNLIFGRAAPLTAAYDGAPLQSRYCTAALSLAAPMHNDAFGISSPFLEGMTIRHDILLELEFPNDFPPLPKHDENANTFRADAELATKAASITDSVHLSLKWGRIIHDVDNNYMTGTLSNKVVTLMKSLYTSCMSLPGQ